MTETPGAEDDGLPFRKSTHSGGNGCVEVAYIGPDEIRLRDSKATAGPQLVFNDAEWAAFLAGVRDGEFDFPGRRSP